MDILGLTNNRMPRLADNFRSPLGLTLFLGTTAVGVALDLWTKALAVRYLENATSEYALIPNWLHFTFTKNEGAVFGLGQGQRPLFLLVSVGAIVFLTYLYAISAKRRFQQFVLGMLMAGVIGNMYDRLVLGYVRDMIHALPHVYWPGFIAEHLPPELARGGVFPWIFNVADTLLCVGVFLMVVYSFVARPAETKAAESDPDPLPGAAAPTQQRP
jgi:signal peptidase II